MSEFQAHLRLMLGYWPEEQDFFKKNIFFFKWTVLTQALFFLQVGQKLLTLKLPWELTKDWSSPTQA